MSKDSISAFQLLLHVHIYRAIISSMFFVFLINKTAVYFILVVQRAKYIVYTTKSNCNAFNEKIVTKQLEKFNEIATTNNYLQYEFVSSIPHDKFNFFTAIIKQEVRTHIYNIFTHTDIYIYIYIFEKGKNQTKRSP